MVGDFGLEEKFRDLSHKIPGTVWIETLVGVLFPCEDLPPSLVLFKRLWYCSILATVVANVYVFSLLTVCGRVARVLPDAVLFTACKSV